MLAACCSCSSARANKRYTTENAKLNAGLYFSRKRRMYNPAMDFPKTYRTNAGWALSIGAILALFSNLRNEQRAVISLAVLGAAGFLWSAREHGWIRLDRKSIPRVLAILGGFFLIAWFVWPLNGRHLNQEQKEGLAKIRDGFPKQCGILIYVPSDSMESQNYGKEIQGGLQLHGGKANIIHEGVLSAPIGILVGVRSSLEPCGYAGEMLSGGMDVLKMPTRFVERFPRADETVVIVFVGTKPPYD
jgi:hypothetical protein